MNKSKEAAAETPVMKESGDTGPLRGNKRRKLTKDFKEAAVRRVEEGTPVKQVARVCGVDPPTIRAWRAEVRDLGSDAFSRNNRRRKFTKEFKEAAVRRVEEGTPVKRVANAFKVDPNVLRRWRDASRKLGANAFPETKAKTRAIIFRLTEEEHNRLKAIAKTAGERSLSSFARSRLLNEIARPLAASARQKELPKRGK
jgi:transposase-like protein